MAQISRREFLQVSAMAAVGLAAAACAKTPTTAPATATPKPQEATATPKVEAKAGGKESPVLAEQVKAGKLPAIDARLPANPLVIKPVHGIGQFGGKLRTLQGAWEGSIEEWFYGNSPIRWEPDGVGMAPMHCDEWSTNADNSEWTFHFRKGLKWSDGQPVTVDDVLFWWEDMAVNPDHPDVPPDYCVANGKLAEFIKTDDFTLTMKYSGPAPLTAFYWANFVNGNIGPRWIAPKHYMQQFHPKYNAAVKDFKDMGQKILWRNNAECPTCTAWKGTSYQADVRRVLDRNAYYYVVDTEGNQLPYMDTIDQVCVQDAEVQKLNLMQGEVDFLERDNHKITLGDMSTLKANEEKGNFTTILRDGGDGTGRIFFWNHDHPDAKIRELFRNPKFKQAMSYAHDRPTIQKVVYYNTGIPTTGTMSPKAIEFRFSDEAKSVFEKARTAYVEYDPAKAKALLDEIGLKDVDGDGWREYPDGSKLEVVLDLSSAASPDGTKVTEIAAKTWQAIGLNTIINQVTSSEYGLRWTSGKGAIRCDWEAGDGPNFWVYPSWVIPNEATRQWPLSGQRFAVMGTEKEDTELDKSPWERNPPRFASTERNLIDSLPSNPVWTLQEIYSKARVELDEIKRHHYAWDVCQIHIDSGPYMLGCLANTPTLTFVSKNVMNCPTHDELPLGGFSYPWILPDPALHLPETLSFKKL